MRNVRKIAAALAALAMVAAPASAATNPADLSTGTYAQRGTAGFAGLSLTLRGDRGLVVPRARLALGFDQVVQDGASARPARTIRATTLELGLSSRGKPDLYVGGQRVTGTDDRLGITPVGAVLVVGGLAVGALAVSALSSDDELHRRQCFIYPHCTPRTD